MSMIFYVKDFFFMSKKSDILKKDHHYHIKQFATKAFSKIGLATKNTVNEQIHFSLVIFQTVG
jgi:hypothetical protein